MDLKLPEDIYLCVSNQINTIVASLESLSSDKEIANAKRQALETFTTISDQIKDHITALQQNSEWDTFTIAFYGETNAGKSTLIETLRILLKESGKEKVRADFIALRDKYGITDERLGNLHASVEKNDELLAALQSKLDTLDQQFGVQTEALHEQLAKLQQLIDQKISATLWQKIMRILGRLPEQRERRVLMQAQRELNTHHKASRSEFQTKQTLAVQAKSDYELQLREFELLIAQLMELSDGAIIGTGKPDFTMNTQAYYFKNGTDPFALLDVPGIEGSEVKVKDEIWAAVQKAHAVFYVSGKPTPPQQGSDKHDGTLQKIKRHLGAQTEVWTIYNKRITNPLPLNQAELINEGERDSLEDLDEKMTEELGDHYQGTISLSALPAFLAVAECLFPGSPHAGSRTKFLAKFNQETILHKSNLSGLRHFLLDDLVKNHKQKIYRSNFNKANQVVLTASQHVDTVLNESFRPLATQLKRNATMSGKQLDKACDALKTRLESQAESAISDFVSKVRRQVYAAIDDDISNDDFKRSFSYSLEMQQRELTQRFPELMEKEVKNFQTQIADIVERLQELSSELLSAYSEIELNGMETRIALDIKIDNGINIPGLISTLIGGVLMMWNPIGWVGLALGAVALVVGVVKAVMGFFSSDYKRSQQRKAVDANLSDISEKMRRSLHESLSKALPQLDPKVEELKKALKSPGEQIAKVVDLLAYAGKQLNTISHNIKTGGSL